MQIIGVRGIFLAGNDSLTPRAPAPQLPRILSWQPLYRLLALIFIHLHALAHSRVLLVLHLEDAADALYFLRQVACTPPPLRRLRRIVALVSRSQRSERVGLAGLVLDNARAETAGASAALNALLAFAGASAHATQVVAVSCAPTPSSNVIGVGVPQVLPTRRAKPDDVVAVARRALKGRGGECPGRLGVPEERAWVRRRRRRRRAGR